MGEPIRIPVRELAPSERADLARLLFRCGMAVRPVKVSKTPKGATQPYIEYWDAKERTIC